MNAEYLSQQRYDKGVTSYLEVIETQRMSFDAQLAYSQVYQELLSAYLELYRALGGGWISSGEKATAGEEVQ
jgi:multidrug efflux system outer membrane protein